MPTTGDDVIRRYLDDAVAAEKNSEAQLEEFAREGEDDEIRAMFTYHLEETRRQQERLTARLRELGGSASSAKSFLAQVFGLTPKPVHVAEKPEERTAQHLVIAFAMENGECAMYEALVAAAEAAGDDATEKLAREIQEEEKQAADKLWRFIPSRAKIAFNLLTVGETDPAVNTKAHDNPLL